MGSCDFILSIIGHSLCAGHAKTAFCCATWPKLQYFKLKSFLLMLCSFYVSCIAGPLPLLADTHRNADLTRNVDRVWQRGEAHGNISHMVSMCIIGMYTP